MSIESELGSVRILTECEPQEDPASFLGVTPAL